MKSTIEEIKHQIIDNNLKDGDYCIILYHLSLEKGKQVKYIYKNIEEFETKSTSHLQNMPEDEYTYAEWRSFD